MESKIKILVVDDHPILLEGLQREIEKCGFKQVYTAHNGLLALKYIEEKQPHIAILDIEMPELTAFEVIQKAISNNSTTKFIILTSHKERGYIMKAQKLNLSGYILKDEPFNEVKQCITAVLKGETYFSKLFNDIVTNEISPELKKIAFLSPSERTILRLIAQDRSSKEIGQILDISPRTVQKHRGNIIYKLDLTSDKDSLVSWAFKNKELIESGQS